MGIGFTWPPPYILKVSKRARHVHFKISRKKGLEITIPYRFNQARLMSVLEEKRNWLEKHGADIQYFIDRGPQEHLPHIIHLAAIHENWHVHYRKDDKKTRLIKSGDYELLIAGKTNNHKLCQSLLKNWLKTQAKLVLTERLNIISKEIKLPYNKLSIKLQATRWGSCSHTKMISLNAKLLFLPPDMVRSVLIHELCHTVHLNHSRKFWELVAKFEPNWREYNLALRNALPLVPEWTS